jgi:predicted O-methyltransferase YrrM
MTAYNIEGWMQPCELDWLTKQAFERRVVVEFGAWKGRSTTALVEACPGTVFTVEHFMGSPDEMETFHKVLQTAEGREGVRRAFLENTHGPRDDGRLFLIEMDTRDAEAVLRHVTQPRGVDMVFIDADHSLEGVRCDIRIAWNLLCPGGMICGHDYEPNWPGVKRAVDELLGGHFKRGPGSLWYAYKNGVLPDDPPA